jgi:type IV secretory pathway VirB2 component (pilin)
MLVAGTGVTALFTSPAAAQTEGSESSCGSMPAQFQDIAELLTRIQELGIALALLIASIMLIYGGVMWMRGTPDSQQKARSIIFNTIIGLVIVLTAGGLVEFVQGVLCGGG